MAPTPEARRRSDRAISVRLQGDPEIINAIATIICGALEDNGLTVVDRTQPQELCAGGARVYIEAKI